MKFERKLKKCGIWMACAYKAEKGVLGIEDASDRRELYQYVYYGSAKIGIPFTDKCRVIKNNSEHSETQRSKKRVNRSYTFKWQRSCPTFSELKKTSK